MMPRAVLFDCDGVIVDSEEIGLAMLRDNLAAHGLDLALDDMHRLFVGGTLGGVALRAREMGARLPEDWVAASYEKLYARLADGTPLIPGIEAVLDALDAVAIPYAVGSNGTTRKMGITLGQHPGVWGRVKDHLYSGQEISRPKPEPDLYLYAAAALDVAPELCVVIDDSASGCRAGIGAGIRTLGFARAGNDAQLAPLGIELFHDMAELPVLLGL